MRSPEPEGLRDDGGRGDWRCAGWMLLMRATGSMGRVESIVEDGVEEDVVVVVDGGREH